MFDLSNASSDGKLLTGDVVFVKNELFGGIAQVRHFYKDKIGEWVVLTDADMEKFTIGYLVSLKKYQATIIKLENVRNEIQNLFEKLEALLDINGLPPSIFSDVVNSGNLNVNYDLKMDEYEDDELDYEDDDFYSCLEDDFICQENET